MTTEINALEQLYRPHPQSKKLSDTAGKYLPGGVAANGKYLPPYPIYMLGGQGAEMVDIDGNKYIDLLMGAGRPHPGAFPRVRAARRTPPARHRRALLPARRGGGQAGGEGVPGDALGRDGALPEQRLRIDPDGDPRRRAPTASAPRSSSSRAISTGSTTPSWSAPWQWKASPGHPPPHLDSAGIPDNVKDNMLILPYNDPDSAPSSRSSMHADELGGVIVEPVSAFGLGVVPADLEFLQSPAPGDRETGIPLIFDEVVTNFRIALGGAMEYFGIQPDLVCLGKILGGGFAIGGFGGKREIMDKVVTPKVGLWDLSEQIFQSGCFSGNPVSMVAGLAVLEELEKGTAYPQINGLTETLCSEMNRLGERLGVPLMATRVASIFQFHFTTTAIKNKRDAMKANKQAAGLFHLGLRAHGILASAHPLFMSTAHNQSHVDQVLEVSETVLKQMLDSNLF